MAKVSGSYASVVRGVSEQVPQDRRPGQHFEQVNYISDPVRGLARRHGSLMQDEKILAAYDATTYNNWLADSVRHKTFTFFVDGIEYDICYRTTVDTRSLGNTNFAFAFNKISKQFIPVVLASDTTTLTLGGVSAIVNVGKYLFIGGNDIVPGFVGTDKWAASSNQSKFAIWLRGGDYSRTFSVELTKHDGTKIKFSYKTASASYPGLLDTSDILSTDPLYQKKVNDRVNAYNGQVTAWIGTAANDISPANIAQKLMDAAAAAGVDPIYMQVFDATLCIDSTFYKEVSANDGGDGSLVLGVGNEVENLDKVSIDHFAGKIVKVRPKKNNETDALYLKAIPKDNATSGWSEVTWKEVAGYEMLPITPFAIGTVRSGTLYIAGTPESLQVLSGDATPTFKVNEVGDDITSPLPFFIGKKVDYLGLFQDRLTIGSGAVLFYSRPGDYFNWFKGSVLAVDPTDPVEAYALGSEDDTIKSSVIFDKDITYFGVRKQYTVNGRIALVPAPPPVIVPLSSHENAIDANPVNSGNFVFYTKTRNSITSAHQIQIGVVAESPESFEVSQQLDQYIKGTAVEMVAVTAPNCVLIRTEDNRQTLYTYSYLDTATGSERLFDSWSKWMWSADIGSMIGLSQKNSDVLVYMLRHGLDRDGNHKVWVAAERFFLDSKLSTRPYLDSLRQTFTVLAPPVNGYININTDVDTNIYAAYGQGLITQFIGTDFSHIQQFQDQYDDVVTNTWTGFYYDAYVTPTNPYIRDVYRNDRAIVLGRLTLGRLSVDIANSGGMVATVDTVNGSTTAIDFSGRILGRTSDPIGRQPILDTSVPVPVGKEIRECTYTLRAKTFLPLTITGISWIGQYFNNTRRV